MKKTFTKYLTYKSLQHLKRLKMLTKSQTLCQKKIWLLYSIMSTDDIEKNISQIEEAYTTLGNERNRRKYHLDNDFPVSVIQESQKPVNNSPQKVEVKNEIKTATC